MAAAPSRDEIAGDRMQLLGVEDAGSEDGEVEDDYFALRRDFPIPSRSVSKRTASLTGRCGLNALFGARCLHAGALAAAMFVVFAIVFALYGSETSIRSAVDRNAVDGQSLFEVGSWPGEDCSQTKRCNMHGFACYEKNEYWSSCMETCNHHDNKGWTCKRLGGFIARPVVKSEPDGKQQGTSLYCLMVVSAENTATPEEERLLSFQRTRGTSVFACDAHAVHHAPQALRGDWKSVANVKIFADMWDTVREHGVYKHHDWTVKVDPDTMFLPQRLRNKLQSFHVPADAAVYMQNTNFKKNFQGSLEVVSTAGLTKYLEHQHVCLSSIGTTGGEDYFFKSCIEAAGVGHMKRTSILLDKYTWSHGYDMGNVHFCRDGVMPAFHPLKTVELWQQCLAAAENARQQMVKMQ